MAGSLLRALGLTELIAGSPEEYDRIGQELLDAPLRLAAPRSKLAQRQPRHAVFDSQNICRDLESAFVLMWRRHQQNEPLADSAVMR